MLNGNKESKRMHRTSRTGPDMSNPGRIPLCLLDMVAIIASFGGIVGDQGLVGGESTLLSGKHRKSHDERQYGSAKHADALAM
jgi:hypothetical protein